MPASPPRPPAQSFLTWASYRHAGALGLDSYDDKRVTAALARDLDGNWEVLGEAVQQAMRAASIAGATGMQDPYERLKELTRGKKVDGPAMREFIGGLGLPDDVESRLLALEPGTYTGLAWLFASSAVVGAAGLTASIALTTRIPPTGTPS